MKNSTDSNSERAYISQEVNGGHFFLMWELSKMAILNIKKNDFFVESTGQYFGGNCWAPAQI